MITSFEIGKNRVLKNSTLTAQLVHETLLRSPEELTGEKQKHSFANVSLLNAEGVSVMNDELVHVSRETPHADHYIDVYGGEITLTSVAPGTYNLQASVAGERAWIPGNVWILSSEDYDKLLSEELSIDANALIDLADEHAILDVISSVLETTLGDLVGAKGSRISPPVCEFLKGAGPSSARLPSTLFLSTVQALASECRQLAIFGAATSWTFDMRANQPRLTATALLDHKISPAAPILTEGIATTLLDNERNEVFRLEKLRKALLTDVTVEAEPGTKYVGMSVQLSSHLSLAATGR